MKKALTIGELLVTMAIIGVIAVLVLPSFLKDYHNKLYVMRLKKVYEMVEIAINQACIDNNVSYFYQTPYGHFFSGVKNQQAFLDKYFKKEHSTVINPFSATYKNLSGSATTSPSGLVNSGWAKLQGGEAIHFFCQYDISRCVIRVDINSTNGPNIMGRDFFTIAVDTHTNKLGGIDNSAGNTYDPAKCGSDNYGYGCLEKIIEDNWEMKY